MKIAWIKDGSTESLMWGHLCVGQISQGENGTWYAYYRHDINTTKGLKDYVTPELARLAVETALEACNDK